MGSLQDLLPATQSVMGYLERTTDGRPSKSVLLSTDVVYGGGVDIYYHDVDSTSRKNGNGNKAQGTTHMYGDE